MRMWMTPPEKLCINHLLGEHFEHHKHRHSFEKGHRVDGRLYPVVQIEPSSMEARHNELAREMLRRGYKHNSPYTQPDLSKYPAWVREAKVDPAVSLEDLCNRCPACRELNSYI
jgi:hypothetical protein